MCEEIFYEITVEVTGDLKDTIEITNKFRCSAAKDTNLNMNTTDYYKFKTEVDETFPKGCINLCYDTDGFSPSDNYDEYCAKLPASKCTKDAKIYIFDDSFSALDFLTESRLRARLKIRLKSSFAKMKIVLRLP